MSADVEIKNTIGLEVQDCTVVQEGNSYIYTYNFTLEWPNDRTPPDINTNLSMQLQQDNNPSGIKHYELFCNYTADRLPLRTPDPGTTTSMSFSSPPMQLDVNLIGKSAAVTFAGTNPNELKVKKAKKDGIVRQPPVPTK